MDAKKADEKLEILLVEDNPGDVRLTEERLADAGLSHNLTVVEDGEAAIAYLKQQDKSGGARRPDLILLDLNLPRKDGRQVLSEIRATPELRDIPVAVLTVSREERDLLKAYDLEAPFINKPVEVEELRNVIELPWEYWITAEKPPEGEE